MKSKSAFRLVRTGSTAAGLLAAALAALFATHTAQATAISWNLTTGGNWDASTPNWAGDSTTFADDGTVDVTFDKTNGGAIVVAADMSPLSTTVSAASGTYTFSGGPINSGTLIKSNGGTLTLSTANSFSGVTLNGGTLNLTHNNAIGTNTLTLNGGTVSVNNNFTFPNNPFNINGDCTFSVPTASYIYFGSGPITLGNHATVTLQLGQSPNLANAINNNGYNLSLINTQDGGTTISGKISGAGGLTLRNDLTANNKTLTVNNATSDFTGPTTLLSSTASNQAIVTSNLSNAGVAGSLGMPAAGADAIIQAYNGVVWRPGGTTDRGLNLASNGAGTVTINPSGNAAIGSNNTYGGITATGTGAKTLFVNLPWNNNTTLTINGAISNGTDGSPLTLNFGPGLTDGGNFASLHLKGVNTFTGPINYQPPAGTPNKFSSALNITGAGQLGAGTYSNTISMGTTPWAIFNFGSSATQTLSGVISGAGKLQMSGAGSLTLSNANTYSGLTELSAGTLILSNNLALQNSALSIGAAGNITLSGVTTLTLGGLAGSRALATVISSGYAGVTTLSLNTPSGLSFTYSGAIADNGSTMSLIKSGAGTQVLSGSNAYTGTTTISGGVLQATLPGGFLSLDGGTLQSIGVSTFNRALGTSGASTFQITANGGGFSATGGQLTVNIGGASTEQTWGTTVGSNLIGTLQLGSLSATAKTLFENPIDLNAATRTVDVSANVSEISGLIRTSSGTAGLTKTGAGTLILSAANTYNGPTTLNGGVLMLTNGSYSGGITHNAGTLTLGGNVVLPSVATPPPITLLTGMGLTLDNTTTNNDNRVVDGQAFILAGGNLVYKGATTISSTETIAALTATNGSGLVTVTYGGSNTATLTAASFVHTTGNGSVLVNGTGLGMDTASTTSVGRMILTTPPTLAGTTDPLGTGINSASKNTKIVPYLVGEATTTTGGLGTQTGAANTFLTYEAGTGLRPLNPTDEFDNNPSAYTEGNNVRITTANTYNPATSLAINSLVMNGNNLTIADGKALTVTSALLFASSNTIQRSTSTGTGTLNLGSAEVMITVPSGITGTISTTLTGAGFTKSGAGTLYLWPGGQNNSGPPNLFTGAVTLAAGTLQFNSNGSNGVGTGPFTILGGTINIGGNNIHTLNNSAYNLNGDFTTSGNSLILSTGSVAMGTNVTVTATNSLTVNGVISDGINDYGLTKDGTGAMYLTNAANSYSGKTIIKKGTLAAGMSNAGSNSAMGAPTGGNAVVDFYTGATFAPAGTTISSDRGFNLNGTSGTCTISQATNGQTCSFGGVTASGSGAKTLAIFLGNGGTGDYMDYTFNGAITDVTDGSPVSLQFTANNQYTVRTEKLTLNGVNTFTGPIIVSSAKVGSQAILTIGGAGQLGSGSSANTISLNTSDCFLTYASSATQTLSGAISGAGNVTKSGAGSLTLSGTNSYTGATAISAGTLKLSAGSLANTAIAVTGTGTLAVQPGSATAISAGNTATAAAGATLNLGARILDMTDGFVSAFNLVQGSSFASTALTVTNGATFKMNLAASGADLLAVTKAATVSGTVNVTIDTTGAGSLTPGTYNLITASSGLGGGTWQFTGGGTTQEVTIGASTYELTLNAGATAVSVTVAGSGTPYDTWANGTFVPPLTLKGTNDNQDGDSLNNLQEFAFGTQPTVTTGEIVVSGASVTPGTPKIVAEGGNYYMVFARRKDYVAAGLTYTVEFTAGLDLWGDNNDLTNPPVSLGATDGTIDAMRVLFPPTIHVASGDPKPTFARVRVIMAP